MRPLALLMAGALAACTVGPDYQRPTAPPAAQFKELTGWKPAAPLDAIDRGAWWSIYHDATLDGLEREIDVSNQSMKFAYANFMEAQALITEAEAQLMPFMTVNPVTQRLGGGTGSGTPQISSAGVGVNSASARKLTYAKSVYSLQGQMNWTLDVWGGIRRTIESRVAGAQASAAQLAFVRLSAQSALASAYFNMRAADSLQKLLNDTVVQYRAALKIVQNQFDVGVAQRLDVLTAETQVRTTEAQAIAVAQTRAQFEHAIAVLAGRPPSTLSIPPAMLTSAVPVVPSGLPSTLLERRPDVATAERQMQQANALIGAAIAAYFPDVTLNAAAGYTGNPLDTLIRLANQVWSVGAAAVTPVFEGGLLTAQVAANRALYEASVATYRETVLTAFQQVEDALVALHVLQDEAAAQDLAVADARQTVALALNQYRAGTVIYTTVLTDETLALSDEITALTIRQNRLLASVALVTALGGGWSNADLPDTGRLWRENFIVPAGG